MSILLQISLIIFEVRSGLQTLGLETWDPGRWTLEGLLQEQEDVSTRQNHVEEKSASPEVGGN